MVHAAAGPRRHAPKFRHLSLLTPLELPLRETLGDYRLLNRVGLGAHGIVYHAENLKTEQHVALKLLHVPKGEDADETRERFEREAQTLARLNHPNIIAYEGSGVLPWQGRELPFLAVEYLEEMQTLDGAAPSHPPEWTLDRIDELLAALACMHRHTEPIVHRGLKATNLGVGRDDALRVLDLGLARVQDSQLTAPSVSLGSLGYIAPEQFSDSRNADGRADLFAVGMIVMELLGGANPLRMMKPSDAVGAIMEGRIPVPPRPLPYLLRQWTQHMTACYAEDRPPDAEAARDELRGVRSLMGAIAPWDDVASTPAWKSISSALRRARRIESGGVGLLLVGPAGPLPADLTHLAVGHAEEIAMTVLHAGSFPELARDLGHSEVPDLVFKTLAALADENPTLVVFDVFSPADENVLQLFHLAATSRVPLVLLASALDAPAQTTATVISLGD